MPRRPERERAPARIEDPELGRSEPENEIDDDVHELAEWIKRNVVRLKDDDGGRIVIVCQNNSDNPVVDTVDASEVESLEALAEKVYEIAENDAERSNNSHYAVKIDGVEARYSLLFAVDDVSSEERPPSRGNSGDDGGGYRNVQGMSRGIPVEGWVQYAKQRDQHEQFLYDASLGERREVYKLMQRVITEQQETIRGYEKERSRERVLIEELMSSKHIRDLEVSRIQKEEGRKDEALNLLKPWAHSIGARLLGPKAVPNDVIPVLEQILAVFSTFTPDQVQSLASTGELKLSGRQKQEVMGLFSTVVNLNEQAMKENQANGANGKAASSESGGKAE